MNIFSKDHFLDAWGKVYFPGQPLVSELFQLEGCTWRLPSINGKSISGSAFIDFFEPLDEKVSGSSVAAKPVRYLPRVSRKMVSCSEWREFHLNQNFAPAPTTLWSHFESWAAFTNHVRQRRSNLFSDSRRKQRKLEKELGSLQFLFNDRRPQTLEKCFHWKSEQWRRQGIPDRFACPEHVHLFQELAHRQTVLVSSLGSEEHLVAVHIGILDKGRLYWWVPAYASAYSQYSPGRLLLHFLLEESYKHRHQEFDFLWGDEDYKWYYATHVRLIEEIGHRPLAKRLKDLLKTALSLFPGVRSGLKRLRQKS